MISKSRNSCAAQILGALAARGLLPREIRRLTRRRRGVSVALLPAPRSWAAGHNRRAAATDAARRVLVRQICSSNGYQQAFARWISEALDWRTF